MSAVLDRFDLVLVINLDRRPDRLREMTEQLANVGLAFGERVKRLSASAPIDPGPFSSRGARGCFESHQRALAMAIERNAQSVLIIEDDCDFTSGFGQYVAGLDQWDIFYGGQLPDGTGSHCIALYGEAIEKASRYLSELASRPAGDPRGGPMHVDGAYSWFRKEHPDLRCVIASPAVAIQRASRSDIADLRWFDRMPMIRWAAQLLRTFRN